MHTFIYTLAHTRQVRAHAVGSGNRTLPAPSLLPVYSMTQLPRRNKAHPERVPERGSRRVEREPVEVAAVRQRRRADPSIRPAAVRAGGRTDGRGASTIIYRYLYVYIHILHIAMYVYLCMLRMHARIHAQGGDNKSALHAHLFTTYHNTLPRFPGVQPCQTTYTKSGKAFA